MIPAEIQRKIRHLEISTRRLLNASLLGDSRCAFKGFGFDFDQIREYQVGDDIRFIDWKSSCRVGTMLVKQYIEERNRRIILVVDVSASANYASSSISRAQLHAQVAGVVALAAGYMHDAVGLLLFSDQVECFIPPGHSRAHIRMIVERLFTYKPRHVRTHMQSALEHLARLSDQKALVCIVSDFIDHGFEKTLRCITRTYDIVALRCLDEREQTLKPLGFLTVEDPETGKRYMLDMRGHASAACKNFLKDRLHEQNRMFKRHGIHMLDISMSQPYMTNLINFFRHRLAS